MVKKIIDKKNVFYGIPDSIKDAQYKRWLKKSQPLIKRFIDENIEFKYNTLLNGWGDRIIETVISFKNFDKFFSKRDIIPSQCIKSVSNASKTNTPRSIKSTNTDALSNLLHGTWSSFSNF